ncbi:MATE family efflux transporter [Hominifimenecus sp. rT4P-3]|uniref:MATE family efflux transporter n=1 Tax=Hominifimenecus sp. rT4P-3 TaxID=3242979 RepID=UPI003DA4A342
MAIGKIYQKKKNRFPADAMFSQKALMALIFPLMIEQLLNSLMGTADTMMVSNVSPAAISAASLVDSINSLVLMVFSAMAVGGTVICSQYLGRRDEKKANESARQVLLATLAISLGITVFCVGLRTPLLRLIFGSVEEAVMADSLVYFFYTGLSYPFIALYSTAAAIYRSEGNSRLPMTVSVISNVLNIIGNALLIFGFRMGIAGAAIATLGSRVFSAVVMLAFLRRPGRKVVVRDCRAIRPNFAMIGTILAIAVPNGIENGMFQFGKLAIQSTLSTLGTTALAAQAMTQALEYVSSTAALGIGLALVTVVGQCIGAGRMEEAEFYIKKLTGYAEIVVLISGVTLGIAVKGITTLAGMEAESAELCGRLIWLICFVKCFTWAVAVIPAYGMRAAGDVRFAMIVSTCSMWLCRVSLSIFLVKVVGMGIVAMWIGMFCDWTIRAVIFLFRFQSGKWKSKQVLND